MTICPICDIDHFINETVTVSGNPYENTAIYKNTCQNGHDSYYSEVTELQTEDVPEQ